MKRIAGSVYAITGGNSGIGRATAQALVQELGRFGSADEVARAVVFLLSPDSSYLLGETMVVDGGRSRL